MSYVYRIEIERVEKLYHEVVAELWLKYLQTDEEMRGMMTDAVIKDQSNESITINRLDSARIRESIVKKLHWILE